MTLLAAAQQTGLTLKLCTRFYQGGVRGGYGSTSHTTSEGWRSRQQQPHHRQHTCEFRHHNPQLYQADYCKTTKTGQVPKQIPVARQTSQVKFRTKTHFDCSLRAAS